MHSFPAHLPVCQPNSIILHDAQSQHWLYFHHPVHVLSTTSLADVMPMLDAVQQMVDRHGYYAAGFVSYEAAPAFDRSLTVQPADFPLLWFGLYAPPQVITLPAAPGEAALDWTPSITQQRYQEDFDQIKTCIAQGDTYQVNFSYRLRSRFTGDPEAYFLQLLQAQHGLYGAFVNLDDWAICSASPELFFQLHGDRLTCRPMKGTAARGLTALSDQQAARALQNSEKNRAENLMIVDMIRNDMGRIAKLGTVQVTRLFELEQYPTLWQMTSSVDCLTEAPLAQIFQALFPCASITGAPKPRTMQIIAERETTPRRIYTGTIGFLAPNRIAQFNIAIRTVLVDKAHQSAEYGVGGGIVWDSLAASEFEECQTKAQILTRRSPQFELLESLLWTPEGYFLLDLHLQRLQASARYFAFPLTVDEVRDRLQHCAQSLPSTSHKVRLRVSRSGEIRVEAQGLSQPAECPLRLGIARTPVDAANLFLYHKTTHRVMYDRARIDGCDDVLLWNQQGELTESCSANLVVDWDGQWYTPPVHCGLLAGTMRAWLIQQGKLKERVLYREDLQHCSRVFLINSVRQIQTAILD